MDSQSGKDQLQNSPSQTHPDSLRVFKELDDSESLKLREDMLDRISEAMFLVDKEIDKAGQSYFAAHPEVSDTDYCVFLVTEEDGTLGFLVAVGEANIAAGKETSTAIIIQGKVGKNGNSG